ncbi:SDR family oxidoreductase [Dinoroseobacter sp. PD6]|uniref:SDR family oxidoreductase n=1 Tax=Dinoroseobacter sp. PD6 TaxID=3028384 RepID=UPI00237BE14D|nr:SDR family oxidoreductase [Dinoroseobacter sp. PD6]MDD9717205.1 SDR family oxidoreductase [Dinoroseobacter sp. PD6]
MSQVSGKSVLITGASTGIGEAAARAFAAAGAHVTLLARNGEACTRIAKEIGGGALAIPGDVSDPATLPAAVSQVCATYGKLDILINNAGVITPIAPLETVDAAAWSALIDINLKGVFYGMRAALPVMKARGAGTIITISSGAAHNPLEGWSAYCASKAGAAMLTRCAHHEAGGSGLRIMGLSPGTVATEMQSVIKGSGVNPVSQLDWSVHIPADWPARALVWMCGPEADAYIGTEISLRDEDLRQKIGLTSP